MDDNTSQTAPLAPRNISADLIKTISIFAVVWIHSGKIYNGCESAVTHFVQDLFRFEVAGFILVWAYFYDRSWTKRSSSERKDLFFSKLKYFIRVYLIWGIIYFLIAVDFSALTPKTLIATYFLGYGWAGQYFLIVIIQLLCAYPLIRWVYDRKVLRVIAVAVLILAYYIYGYHYESLPRIVRLAAILPFPIWVPYVFGGMFLSRNRSFIVPIISVGLIILIPIEFEFLKSIGRDHLTHIAPSIAFSALFLCAALMNRRINNVPENIGKVVNFIGRNTITIYLTNPLVIIVLYALLPTNFLTTCTIAGGEFWVPILSTLFVFGVSTSLIKLFELIKLKGILN